MREATRDYETMMLRSLIILLGIPSWTREARYGKRGVPTLLLYIYYTTITWLRSSSFKGRKDLEDALALAADAGIMMPNTEQILQVDPRLLVTLNCQQLRVDI